MNSPIQYFSHILKELSEFLEMYKEAEPLPFVYDESFIPDLYVPESFRNQQSNKKSEKKEDLFSGIQPKENQLCSLCSDKLYAVKEYLKIPEENPHKILVVIYQGSLDRNQLPRDHSKYYYFSSKEEDELFQRMLAVVGLKNQNLYFQQFVACHFSPDSTEEQWESRVQNCFRFLKENIKKYGIKKLLIVGNAALLLFGNEAKKYAKNSLVIPLQLEENYIPSLVLRSPSALLKIEEKRKKFHQQLLQYQEEYRLFVQYKDRLEELKEKIDEQIQKIPSSKKQTIISNVKLISASQLQSQKEREMEIKKHLGEAKWVLYKSVSFRIEEIQIKKQIVNSLKKLVKEDVSNR